MLYPLYKMNPGQTAVISWLADNTSISKRLSDLGFEPGAAIICVLKKHNEEIAAYFVRSALIALRREDAALILVRELKKEEAELHE